MILSFGDKATADLFHNRPTKRVLQYPQELIRPALQKFDMLDATANLQDLRSPPGNRLEMLRGRLRGFHSVRINQQWRIIFRWSGGNCHDVQIIDYHRG